MLHIATVVNAYMACGNKHGFAWAETVLMRFLPANNPDGKCCHVPEALRDAFVEALNETPKTVSGPLKEAIVDSLRRPYKRRTPFSDKPRQAPILPEQIRQIKATSKNLGQTDDEYRIMLASWGVDSCTKLSYRDANDLLRHMRATLQGKTTADVAAQGRTKFDRLAGRPGHFASPAQLRLVEVLWSQVHRQRDATARRQALDTFLQNRFNVMGLEQLEGNDVPKVLIALKAMLAQRDKKDAERDFAREVAS